MVTIGQRVESMAKKPKDMVRGWEEMTGKDRGHSTREVRVLQLAKRGDLGVQGKAADVTPSGCSWFLLADVTGDTITEAAERADQWGGLVRDRSTPHTTPANLELEQAMRAWKASVDGSAVDPASAEDILPGPNLHAGTAALFARMADHTPNVRHADKLISFSDVLSHLRFSIEFLIGGSEGPQALVRCHRRADRYLSTTQPIERIRNARRPIRTTVTLEYAHFAFFGRLLANTTAHATDAQPVPPSSSAYPAGTGNGNAGAIPTAPAPTSKRSSLVNDETAAHTDQNGDRNTPEGNPCAWLNASPLERELSLSVHGVFPHVFFQSGCAA